MAENQYEFEAENVRMRINAVLKEKGLTENSVAAGDGVPKYSRNVAEPLKRFWLDAPLNTTFALLFKPPLIFV